MNTDEFPSLEDREREARTVLNTDNDDHVVPAEGNRLARCVSCRLLTDIRHITSETRNTTRPLCRLCRKRNKRLEKVSHTKKEKKHRDRRELQDRRRRLFLIQEEHKKDKKHDSPIVTMPLKKPQRVRQTLSDKVVRLIASADRLALDVHEMDKNNKLLASTVNAMYMMLSGRQRDANGLESRDPLLNLQLHAPPPVESPPHDPMPSPPNPLPKKTQSRERKKKTTYNTRSGSSSSSSSSSSESEISEEDGSDSDFSEDPDNESSSSSSSSSSSIIDEEFATNAPAKTREISPKPLDDNAKRVTDLRKAMIETQEKKAKK